MSTEISTQRAQAGIALQTFDDAFRFAQMVSKSEFAPKDFRGKPESCLLAVQHGSEIGLSPMQSLQSIAVINGRPSIWGDAALAVVTASPMCEYVTEELEEGKEGETLVAICTAKRRGYPKPTVVRFSVADAKKAGLWGKAGPWSQYPKRMLQLRARGFALRDAFPDVLKGLVTAEEAQDYQHDQSREPVLVRPKFPQAEPPAAVDHSPAKVANAAQSPAASATDLVAAARQAVQRTNSVELLAALRDRVNQRHSEGTFADQQRDELVHLIDTKCEWLEGDTGTEFPHEAAEHEVRA
jgi:hypothetical protein